MTPRGLKVAGSVALVSALMMSAACSPADRPKAPLQGSVLGVSSALDADGRASSLGPIVGLSVAVSTEGTPGFYFLPPVVAEPTFIGTFDGDIATLNPEVDICDVTSGPDTRCGGAGGTPAVIVFTTTSTPAITVDLSAPQYQVNWDTRGAAWTSGHTYRVHVTAGASGARRELGFVDVVLVDKGGKGQHLGRTLPLHFRIETRIPGSLAVSAASSSVGTGGTDLISVTVEDLHDPVLVGAAVTWSVTTNPPTGVADAVQPLNPTSGQTDATGLAATLFKAGTTAGLAIVTAQSAGLALSIPIPVHGSPQKVYVTNENNDSITVYGTGGLTGTVNAIPVATIAGSNTGLNGPLGIALDPGGNIYVVNGGVGISIFAAGANGNVAPTATLAGSNTGLSSPQFLALDATGKLYVANTANDSITVYPAGASGNAAPTATIAGGLTGLSSPLGIGVAIGSIYVANLSADSIAAWPLSLSGNIAPTLLQGGNTGLNGPYGLALDAGGTIYVVNAPLGNVEVFLPGSNQDAPPQATIGGDMTGLVEPIGIALDAGGDLFVANSLANGFGSITVYTPGSNGNLAPVATITGGNTGLNGPFGVAVF